jgi:ADP-dependent phosphofructokinase/glucokinase
VVSTADVVLGFGAAVDREIRWDSDVLGHLARRHGIGPAELACAGPIRTERDLVVSILGFVARGAGGERRVEDPQVITRFCDRFSSVTSLGGTCVRAAAAMQRLDQGATVHLVHVDEEVHQLLPSNVSYLVGEEEHPSYPHLIVQYPEGARVRTDQLDVVAPRANRLIYVNDPANEQLVLSADLKAAVAAARVFLVSGMNAMRSLAQLGERLRYIEECVRDAPRPGLVVYEDAGFHEPEFAAVVRSHMARLVDVYSLSDEELAQAVDGLVDAPSGRPLNLLDPASVHAAVTTLASQLDVPVLVVHSRHWALAVGDDAARFEQALATGVAIATARYAYGDMVTESMVRGVSATAADRAAAAFVTGITALAGDLITCVPVPTMNVVTPTTVGLGDTFVGGFLAACAASPETIPAAPRRAS